LFGLSNVGIFLYFLFFVSFISFSLYISRTKEVTVESYFFANRNIHWLILGISLLMPSLFSPYLLGLSLSGSGSGLLIVYGIISGIMLIVLGWFFVPLYSKIKINTLPEYFEKRFNRTCRLFLSALYIFSNIFLRLIIILIVGSIIINAISGIDAYSFLLFFLIVTGIYIITGGLQAEIYVNIILLSFIVLGALGLSGWIIYQGDGINFYKYVSLSNLQAGTNFTLPGLILGLPIIGFWFWCADQFVVQKVLSVRNISSARKASLFSGFLQIIPILLFILPGVILVTFPPGTGSIELNTLFSVDILPESIKAGVIIAIAACLMASFASLFNSTSVLITFDFYSSFKPSASDRKLVLVGRLTTLILLFCSILLIPTSLNKDFSLGLKLFEIFAYFSAMIAGVFFISLINQKINSASALTTLAIGTFIILLRAVLEIFSDFPLESTLISWLAQFGFFEFLISVFLFSIVFTHIFNRLGWAQHKASSFLKTLKRSYLKLKTLRSSNKKVFIFLSILIIIFLWLTLS
jgi:SSS family solute:Na+ symporter